MGSCVSRSTASPVEGSGRAVATAKVIGLDGSLAQFAAPVTAGEALLDAAQEPSFLCSADELRFDAPARALAPEEALQPGGLYFALPMSMLRRPFSGQEMASLAVKASSALAVTSGKGRKAARVAPLVLADDEGTGTEDGGWSHRAYGKSDALKTVHGGGETVGKTRKRAAGSYGSGTSRPAGVQRLSSILEADD
ncbi:hypothetical protein ACQJBY_044576 [Aegilops geniculata]